MTRHDTLTLLNDHRHCLGRRLIDKEEADCVFPGKFLANELARVEECGQLGNDPWMYEDGENGGAPP